MLPIRSRKLDFIRDTGLEDEDDFPDPSIGEDDDISKFRSQQIIQMTSPSSDIIFSTTSQNSGFSSKSYLSKL